LRTAAADDIELYFVNFLAPAPGSAGEAFPASLVPDARYEDSVIISVAERRPFTVPHEIGHVLMDTVPPNVHYSGPLKYANLMYAPTSGTDTVISTKRLTTDQELDAHSKRPNLLTGP
jgi:hypothetical protein